VYFTLILFIVTSFFLLFAPFLCLLKIVYYCLKVYISLLHSCVLYMHGFDFSVDYRTTGILGLLIKFLTVYLCITFHFFALALGGKGVFYSYKKIVMLHFCN
jgi:hypothetical protein